VFGVLYHEYKHAIDRETKASKKTSFLGRMKAAGTAGIFRSKEYYKKLDEFFAEWEKILDIQGRVPNRKDISSICYLKKRYGEKGLIDRIPMKEKKAKERGKEENLTLDQTYEKYPNLRIQDLDFLLTSPVLMRVVGDCSDQTKIAKKMSALTYGAQKRSTTGTYREPEMMEESKKISRKMLRKLILEERRRRK
jgi:hypothetical protein